MKHILKAQTLSEWIALKINQFPQPLYDTTIVGIQSQVLITAVKSGIFAALIEESKSLDTLAQECNLNTGVLSHVLQVLVSYNYLTQQDDRYIIAKKIKKFFAKDSRQSLENNILLSESLYNVLDQLDDILKTGDAVEAHRTFTDQKHWQIYQASMLELARQSADIIKKHIPVKAKAKLLLDIGGSHGLYGATICREKGIKRSLVLDLPAAINHARPLAQAEGIDDIVEFKTFNVLKQQLNIPCDVILMSNFLHHFDEAQVLSILEQAYRCLKPQGTIAIFDILPSAHDDKNAMRAIMSLFFRLTSNSKCYTVSEYQNFLKHCGFDKIDTKKFIKIPFFQLTTGIKLEVK